MNIKTLSYIKIIICCAVMLLLTSASHIPTEQEINYAETLACSSKTQHLEEKAVPAGDTSFKTYMSYKAITNEQSPQYKLQKLAETDENGLRIIDGYYCVAMGSYYADSIGDKLVIELESGCRINVIIGDFKADKHTDETNRYTNVYDNNGNFISHNVVEFIVDMSTLNRTAKNWGDISAIEGFEGNIAAIYKIIED